MQGYKWARWRVWLCRLAAVLSLGLILIVFHWRPRLAVLARCYSCPLGLADVLLITVKSVPIQIIGLFDYEILFFWLTKPVNQMEIYFMLFFNLQDRFGQKHVVEVLKEELEEGRLASIHLSALGGRGKEAANLFYFLQFGFNKRTGGLWMERHSSAIQRGGQKELKLFVFYWLKNDDWNRGLLLLQKTILRYYIFEGMRYIWMVNRGTFCRVR